MGGSRASPLVAGGEPVVLPLRAASKLGEVSSASSSNWIEALPSRRLLLAAGRSPSEVALLVTMALRRIDTVVGGGGAMVCYITANGTTAKGAT